MSKPEDHSSRLGEEEIFAIFDVIDRHGDPKEAQEKIQKELHLHRPHRKTVAAVFNVGVELFKRGTNAPSVLTTEEAEEIAEKAAYGVPRSRVVELYRLYQLWKIRRSEEAYKGGKGWPGPGKGELERVHPLSEIQELVALEIQGVPKYLYELSQECYAPDFPFLSAETLAKGVLVWKECPGPCQFPASERPERYKEWLECVREHRHVMREHKLIVGEGSDGKPWLRLPSRYKYPDFEKMFPTLLDIRLYKLICLFEEIGGKCIYLWVQLMPYLEHWAIGHIVGAKEALPDIKYDPQIAATLKPDTLEAVQKVKDTWKEVANVIQTWGNLLGPIMCQN